MTSLSAKTRAGRADTDLLGRLVAKVAQVFDLHLKHAGHDIEEAAGTGCALVVHDEIFHHAVLDLDDLHVLPADIDDRAHVWEQERRALGVAGKLAHLLFRNVRQRVAAVAGSQSIIQLILCHPCVCQNFLDSAGRTAGTGAYVYQRLSYNFCSVF